LLDQSVRQNQVLFPDEGSRAQLYPSVPRDEEGLREMTRAWTKIKTGQ
jgi:hypothetical protein